MTTRDLEGISALCTGPTLAAPCSNCARLEAALKVEQEKVSDLSASLVKLCRERDSLRFKVEAVSRG